MPFKSKDRHREYMKQWAERKRRAKGVPTRPKTPSKEKILERQSRWRYGELAKVHRATLELERYIAEAEKSGLE